MRGHLSEARRWLDRALAAGGGASRASRARGLGGAAEIALFQTDYGGARRLIEQAVVLWQELGDETARAYAFCLLGHAHTMLGDLATGRAQNEESAAHFRATGDQAGLMLALNNLSVVARLQGDYPSAVAAASENLALASVDGDPYMLALATRQRGRLAFDEHDTARAQQLLEESLALYRRRADSWQIGATLLVLAQVALVDEDSARATVYADEALVLFRQVGATGACAALLGVLGHAARLAGDGRRAAACYGENLRLFRDTAGEQYIPYGVAGLAWTALWLGRPEAAARLLAAARALPDTPTAVFDHTSHALYERSIASVRTELGLKAFDQAWAAGEALTLEQAATEALVLADEVAALPNEALGLLVRRSLDSPRTRRAAHPDGLTAREVEILALAAGGHSNRAIAETLVLSIRTVERHLDHVYAKTGVHGRQQLRAYAQNHGIALPG